MYLVQNRHDDDTWLDVGVHPTPDGLVALFAAFVASRAHVARGRATPMRILDAFAGDGRLGHAVAAELVRMGVKVELVAIEVDKSRVLTRQAVKGYASRVVVDDVFTTDEGNFDLLVSNPPYLSVNRATAENFGFSWPDVSTMGANLYGLAMRRCLDLLVPSGQAFFLAPYGWINNQRYSGLRARLAKVTEAIEVVAFNDRNLFPNVSQDIAFQAAKKAEKVFTRRTIPRVLFAYSGGAAREVRTPPRREKSSEIRARVGPLVWNRSRDLLQSSKRGGCLLINGGNITKGGTLELSLEKYSARQYVARNLVPASFFSRGPMMLIKRTMRGAPGTWLIDYAVITNPSFECVAENHVIVVDLGATPNPVSYCARLAKRIQQQHRRHGHPNVSAQIVRQAIEALHHVNRDRDS